MSRRILVQVFAVSLVLAASLQAEPPANTAGRIRDSSAAVDPSATDRTTDLAMEAVPLPADGRFSLTPRTPDPRFLSGRALPLGMFTMGSLLPVGSDTVPIVANDAGVLSESRDLEPDSQQQPGATHPKPRHTGFKALVYDTAADFKAFPRRRSTWVILGIGGVAALAVHPADDHVTKELSESEGAKDVFAAGKYIGSVPVQAGLAAGLFIVGRYVMQPGPGGSRTNKVSHLGFDLMRGLIVSQSLTQAIKVVGQRDRPNGECCAFPSGHASAAFATASILERHFGYRGAWPTWLIAAYVGASRLTDNRHFISDVVFGSALGVASGWTVVGRHGRSDYTLVPVPIRNGVMISLVRRAPSESQSDR
jgi:hypothetical protein